MGNLRDAVFPGQGVQTVDRWKPEIAGYILGHAAEFPGGGVIDEESVKVALLLFPHQEYGHSIEAVVFGPYLIGAALKLIEYLGEGLEDFTIDRVVRPDDFSG